MSSEYGSRAQPHASTSLFELAPQLLFGRFQLLEELGAGMQGSVFRAFDTFTRGEVALKILRLQQGSQGLVRFKNEFRALASLIHPNLVRLGELFERDHVWAFSMELVRGGDFLGWVRPDGASFSEPRLRAGLAQTSSALSALHGARLIHRDLKPENLRVTPDGRIVLMDFGLVTERGPSARTASQHLVGTLGYIAPEVIQGELAAEKSDLYALGAMLYQALTGVLPYDGSLFQIALAQRAGPPKPPSSVAPGVPPDLDELCMALLANDPERRPNTERVRAQLCEGRPARATLGSEAKPEQFFGREAELAALQRALRGREAGGLCSVVIQGESGIGKSALLSAFVRQTRRETRDCVVLSGHCHAREHVSYNAFDDVFDGLARLLVRLGDQARDAALPAGEALLPLLSPHFAKIPGIASAKTALLGAERAHLFDAFIDLLANLSQTLQLLITIEDVHWADSDSLQLLHSMLDRAAQLDLCLVLTSRSPERDPELTGPGRELLGDPRLTPIALAPLDPGSAAQLAAHVLAAQPSADALAKLTAEAAGSPIFLIELALAHSAQREGATLEETLRARLATLPANARAVIETLAVAGAPLSLGVLMAALQLSIEDLYGIVALLRRERLAYETSEGALIVYHDRVAQAATLELTPEHARRVHAALASAFEQTSFLNPLRAAQHWLLAGDLARAAPALERAAARALDNAVFEQAAELYRQRLELKQVGLSEAERRTLQIKLATALAAAGHCTQSAHTLLAALEGATREQRRELSLRAAQQLLQAGELEEGTRAAALALEQVDLPWRGSAATALLHLAVERLQIRAAQVSYLPPRRHDAQQVERQLDTLMQLTHPLAWSDLARSMELSARGLLLALRERRADYLPMLLAAEAVQATLRNPDSAQGSELLREATGWLNRDSASRERAYCTWAGGAIALLKTTYGEACGLLREAERQYRLECPQEAWMRVNARGMLLNSLLGVGEHLEFVQKAESWNREAQAQGDLYARAYYSVGGQAALRHLIADAPDAAVAEIEGVMQPWRASWGLHQLLRVKCLHDVMSYAGGDRAHEWWRRQARVPPLTPAFFAEGFAWRRADAALRAGIARGERALVRSAGRMLEPLAHAVTPYVRVFSGLTAMQIALIERRTSDGLRVAARIERDLQAQDDFRTAIYGALLGAFDAPTPGPQARWEEPLQWFTQRGWKAPERALAWVLPVAAVA